MLSNMAVFAPNVQFLHIFDEFMLGFSMHMVLFYLFILNQIVDLVFCFGGRDQK